MNKIKRPLLSILFAVFIFVVFSSQVSAQLKQTINTVVGNPDIAPIDAVDDSGQGVGSDGLAPGEFIVPFRCGLKYYGSTYGPSAFNPDGHSPYSVDFNRVGANDLGDPVLASADGTVSEDKYFESNGQITINHQGGYQTLYAHMRMKTVSKGDKVKVGQKIGEIGNVGNSTGPHLHLNHLYKGKAIKIKFYGKPYPASLSPSRDATGPRVTGYCP